MKTITKIVVPAINNTTICTYDSNCDEGDFFNKLIDSACNKGYKVSLVHQVEFSDKIVRRNSNINEVSCSSFNDIKNFIPKVIDAHAEFVKSVTAEFTNRFKFNYKRKMMENLDILKSQRNKKCTMLPSINDKKGTFKHDIICNSYLENYIEGNLENEEINANDMSFMYNASKLCKSGKISKDRKFVSRSSSMTRASSSMTPENVGYSFIGTGSKFIGDWCTTGHIIEKNLHEQAGIRFTVVDRTDNEIIPVYVSYPMMVSYRIPLSMIHTDIEYYINTLSEKTGHEYSYNKNVIDVVRYNECNNNNNVVVKTVDTSKVDIYDTNFVDCLFKKFKKSECNRYVSKAIVCSVHNNYEETSRVVKNSFVSTCNPFEKYDSITEQLEIHD